MRPLPPAARPLVASRRLRLIVTAAAVVLVAATAAAVSWRYLFRFPNEPLVDLRVYQQAGDAVRAGGELYEAVSDRLVFTYPPFAALVAVLITPVTGWWVQLLWTAATVGALVGVVVITFRPLLARAPATWRPLAAGALVTVALLSHPVVEHVFFGQVNLFLVLLCVIDFETAPRRLPKGVLTGVATALKLTPAVFVVHLWTTGQRRAAGVAAATTAACTLLALAALPSDSVDYWTRVLFEGERVTGSVTYTSNQSLLGLVSRLVPEAASTVVWLVLAVGVAIVGFVRARAAHEAGDERGAFAIVALLAVLLSPIAWIHHVVWFIPMVAALAADGRDRRRLVAASLVGLILLLRLPWWGWALMDQGIVGGAVGVLMHNAYVLLGLALLLGYPIASGERDAPLASPHGRTRRNRADRPVPAGSR